MSIYKREYTKKEKYFNKQETKRKRDKEGCIIKMIR